MVMDPTVYYETYKGVIIWYRRDNERYTFIYANVDYEYDTPAECRAQIDVLVETIIVVPTISIQVMEKDTWRAVPDAVITFGRYQSRTGSDGFAYLTDIAIGSYELTITATGYETKTDTVEVAETTTAIAYTLTPTAPEEEEEAEEEEVPEPEPVTLGPPWPFNWISGILEWFGGLWQGFTNTLHDVAVSAGNVTAQIARGADTIVSRIESGASSVGTAISALPRDAMNMLIGSMGALFTKSADESIKQALETLPAVTGHSPGWKQQIEATTTPFANDAVAAMLGTATPEAYTKSIIDPEEAAGKLTLIGAAVAAANVGVWIAHLAAEAATLGQLEAVGDLAHIVIGSLGVNAISSRALMIPIEKSVLIPAERHYNALYTPEIPSYQDLINQVVKEVIPLDEFKKQMKYLGYAEEWSQRIWDAHFIAPSLNDLLTAWRRGIITEEELDRLMILVDLDPRFKEIFDTRKYVTPPLSMTRFLWETGAITREGVERNVKLEGYAPEHVAAIVEFITEFQERMWRRRYLVTLQGGYQKGVYSSGELEKAVVDAGYTPDVAKWIIATADARKKIAEAGVTTEKPKLLSIGDLKKAYTANMITRDALSTELALRGYPLDQATLLVQLLDQEKVVESAGGSKVALSQAELVNAWRYDEITEDQLRIELQLRGLSVGETEILINTKKKQWGVGGQEGPEADD